MNKVCTHRFCAILAIFAFLTPVSAQTAPSWLTAQINEIFADPSDIVLVMDNSGPCGSNMFHIKRSTANFTEMTSLMYTAAATSRTVSLYVSWCEGDRNIVSHGVARFR